MALLFCPYLLRGQSADDIRYEISERPSAYVLSKMEAPIQFDGHIGTGEWDSVDTLSLISHWPVHVDKPNMRTLFRVAYDEAYLYFSAYCYDTPNGIRAPTFERDIWNMTMDQVGIVLDTYNDNENGLLFLVTPTGSRIDVSIRNDAQGSSAVDLSWNSYWEAKVSLDANGWGVEARIPFSSLRFQPTHENVTMGLIAYRYIARERQMDLFPNIPPQWGFWSFIKPSQAQDFLCERTGGHRPWFTSPYVLAGAGYHYPREERQGYPEKINDNRFTAGLDIQHAVSDNMNMDITVNTDFAQVEADDQVVNLSRFSFFFPEKRRFFLERSSIMDFGFENNNQLFYSRRIGINDGMIVPIWGGARIVGRLRNYDVGVMTIESREEDPFPSENFGVFRVRRRVSKNNSYIGTIATTRTDWKGQTSLAYGVDGILCVKGNDYLKFNMASTYSTVDTADYASFLSHRKRLYALWENRSQVGLNYSLSYSQVDRHYSPSLGFEARANFSAIGDRISYGWFTSKRKSLRYVRLDFNMTSYYSQVTSRNESLLTAPALFMEWKKNSNLFLTLNRYYDNVVIPFRLSEDIEVAAGDYVNADLTVSCQTPSVNFLSTGLNATVGRFYGGQRVSVGVTPTYVISKYLTVSGFYLYNQIAFSENVEYRAHVGRLKISSSLNVKLSVNAFAQLNSLDKLSALNLRVRYNSKDGNDCYLVYNETLNHGGKGDPYVPFSASRSVLLKYIYTFHVAD